MRCAVGLDRVPLRTFAASVCLRLPPEALPVQGRQIERVEHDLMLGMERAMLQRLE